MESKVKISFKKPIILFLTGVMFLLILNNALFLHSHQTRDGYIFQHAHPYNKAETTGKSGETHTHSDLTLILLSDLTLFTFSFLAFILFQTFNITRKILAGLYQWNHFTFPSVLNSRAPPFHWS